ncbi:dienelactone hydrolase family protein [Sphingomonas crusticola]|uniref:dienelactone hydrolase family protein n=1 Tax=Sphingomonas crusticola TaxID=1697973 RepID=UPI000E244879|nr:dienelactone hydrolase family protein [Sphingomonas crusticola]
MHARRAFVLQTIALAAFPAAAAKRPPPPKTANIRWPGPGHALHGYMAIPGGARGAQPAVLVVHDAGGADAFTRSLTDALALAGFVACAPHQLASLEEAVATVRWLATNAYATGRVGAIGLGWGGALVERVAAAPQTQLSAAITFGASEAASAGASVPSLRLNAIGQLSGESYAQTLSQAIAFLDRHLRGS